MWAILQQDLTMIEAIKTLLRNEEQDNVLNMITAIEITTKNEEVYNACLEIRDQLVSDNYSKRNPLRWDILQAKDEQVREEDCDSERKESTNGTSSEDQEDYCETCDNTGIKRFVSYDPPEGEVEYETDECDCVKRKEIEKLTSDQVRGGLNKKLIVRTIT